MESVFDFNMFSKFGRYLEAAREKDRFRGRIFIYYILIGTFYLGPKNFVTLVCSALYCIIIASYELAWSAHLSYCPYECKLAFSQVSWPF